MASSKSTKFWSTAPPLTLKPAEPSPLFDTPGRSWMVFIRSTSPNTAGANSIVSAFKATTPICGFLTLSFSMPSSAVIITSSKVFEASSSSKFNFISSVSDISFLISL